MYYPSSENKGADQLRGYREADLRLCFRICRLLVFPWGGSYILCDCTSFWMCITFLAYDTDFLVIHRYLVSNHRKNVSALLFFINNFVVCGSKRLTSLRNVANDTNQGIRCNKNPQQDYALSVTNFVCLKTDNSIIHPSLSDSSTTYLMSIEIIGQSVPVTLGHRQPRLFLN